MFVGMMSLEGLFSERVEKRTDTLSQPVGHLGVEKLQNDIGESAFISYNVHTHKSVK